MNSMAKRGYYCGNRIHPIHVGLEHVSYDTIRCRRAKHVTMTKGCWSHATLLSFLGLFGVVCDTRAYVHTYRHVSVCARGVSNEGKDEIMMDGLACVKKPVACEQPKPNAVFLYRVLVLVRVVQRCPISSRRGGGEQWLAWLRPINRHTRDYATQAGLTYSFFPSFLGGSFSLPLLPL